MIATQGGQPEAVQVLFQVGTNKDLKERKCRNVFCYSPQHQLV